MELRRSIRVSGIVQGVGFRPYVYNRAIALGLTGFVGNDSGGVFIEVEGPGEQVEEFEAALARQAPPMARVERVEGSWVEPVGSTTFEIGDSAKAENGGTVFVSPDIAVCNACWDDTTDPGDRRYGYPFTNCTNCGPRYSIVDEVPYDRATTSMREFDMCSECQREYDDPCDRRFHAQPNACALCGPALRFETADPLRSRGPIGSAADLLLRGGIVGIKGLGGYHLACNARDQSAVAALRERKNRDAKPFAVMVADVDAARSVCAVSGAEASLLDSAEKPIVVLDRLPGGAVAEAVAPANHSIGVMLAYTPMHRLLLSELAVRNGEIAIIVLTSGNATDEPIVIADDSARTAFLGTVADALVTHDRAIVARADDSVVRSTDWGPQILRRSRGYAPSPVRATPANGRTVLACGGQLKNTFTFLRDGQAFVSPHVGDLHSAKTTEAFENAVSHYESLFGLQADVVAHDLHPQYTSTRYALGRSGVQTVAVQHHEAHIASVMAEARIDGDVIGMAADGTGLGTDGTIWGGEFFVGGFAGFERAGHFGSVPLPGSEQAIRQPWRMGCVYLQRTFGDSFLDLELPFASGVDRDAWRVLDTMIRRGVQTPLTSSVGRLFDALAAIVGLSGVNRYEGQAAIELEHHARAAGGSQTDSGPGYEIDGGAAVIQVEPMIRGVVEDLLGGTPVSTVAHRVHRTIAQSMVDQAVRLKSDTGLARVALGGGVFQNRLLTGMLYDGLRREGFEVFLNRLVPTNDGGLSLGQAAIAAVRSV